MITACIPKLLFKKNYFFPSLYLRMNGKSINFNDKKIKKVTFIIKTKKIFNIDDINANKILVSKKKDIVNIIPPNTLLGMIIKN